MKHKVKAHSLAAFKTLMETLRSELSMAGETVIRVKIHLDYQNDGHDTFKATVWSKKIIDKENAK